MNARIGVESLEAKLLKFETYVIAQLLSLGLSHDDAHEVAQEILCGVWITMAAVRLRKEAPINVLSVLFVWANATCKWQAMTLVGSALAETAPRTLLLALLALPAEYREPLTLMAVGMMKEDIAARLNVDTNAVDRRIVAGRSMLAEEVDRRRRGAS